MQRQRCGLYGLDHTIHVFLQTSRLINPLLLSMHGWKYNLVVDLDLDLPVINVHP